VGAVPVDRAPVQRLLEAAAAMRTPALTPVGELVVGGCRWWPLVPPAPILRRAAENVDNEASLVLVVRCGGRDLLLTGDAGTEVEPHWPVDRLRGAVLKVGHHGSRTATAPATVEALRPRIALVSVGHRNPFRLPRDEVLARLRRAGVAVYRTDRDGAIVVGLDGRRTVSASRWSAGDGARRAWVFRGLDARR
jgi:competence protein ComEC